MAATRLITLHANKGKTISQSLKDRIDYAENYDKTDNGELISSYACDPKTVEAEFMDSKKEYLRNTGRQPQGDIIAYQIRQSFKPGEITPQEANEVGYETALRFTKGNHAFIVATHTDREHIHNHVIFNSTNLSCNRKFRDSWFVALVLQKVSDLVCLEHGLSVIKPRKPGEREKRVEFPQKESYRAKISADIDAVLLQNPVDFDEFISLLKRKNYEIKKGAYVSIKGNGQNRFIRLRSLGEGYTETDIEKRILGVFNGTIRPVKKRLKKEFDLLVDIQKKISQGKGGGYARWATVYNIKQMAQTLLFLQERNVRDYETLEKMASDTSTRFNELSQSIKSLEQRLGEIAVLRTHIINYAKTRDVYVDYRKAGYSKKYLEDHREEITLHKAAKEAFGELPDNKIPKVKELNAEYAKILTAKKEAYVEYRHMKKEMQEYVMAKHNVDSFLENYEKENLQSKEKQKRSER